MKKRIVCLTCSLLLILSAQAGEISKLIKNFEMNRKAKLSVYVKNLDDNSVIYKKNEKALLNPASTLKILSYGASLLTLGDEYNFETALYQDGSDIYLKLSGDAKLTQKDLKELFSKVKNNDIENIYIDDSIFVKEQYPSTWLDEDKFPYLREITPYIIDSNNIKLAIKRSSLATNIDIVQEDEYKIAIINNLKNSQNNKQEIKIEKLHGENSPILTISGEITKDEIIDLPVLNPEINFIVKLEKALKDNDIVFIKKITAKKVPQGANKIAFVSRNIKEYSDDILLNSDNFITEVIAKVCASNYYKKSATFNDEIKMFDEIYQLSLNDIKIADASGVSRQNLITTEFYINAIEMLYNKTQIKNLLMNANEGTMKDRGLFLQNNLKAKTGTLRSHSSIFADLTTKNNNNIVLISIEQDAVLRNALLKNFEDMLIGLIYRKY